MIELNFIELNFENSETYHFYKWVETKADALIRKALAAVETDDWYQMGMDVSTVARDQLAELLNELLDRHQS